MNIPGTRQCCPQMRLLVYSVTSIQLWVYSLLSCVPSAQAVGSAFSIPFLQPSVGFLDLWCGMPRRLCGRATPAAICCLHISPGPCSVVVCLGWLQAIIKYFGVWPGWCQPLGRLRFLDRHVLLRCSDATCNYPCAPLATRASMATGRCQPCAEWGCTVSADLARFNSPQAVVH
jgi:hypothetical protein